MKIGDADDRQRLAYRVKSSPPPLRPAGNSTADKELDSFRESPDRVLRRPCPGTDRPVPAAPCLRPSPVGHLIVSTFVETLPCCDSHTDVRARRWTCRPDASAGPPQPSDSSADNAPATPLLPGGKAWQTPSVRGRQPRPSNGPSIDGPAVGAGRSADAAISDRDAHEGDRAGLAGPQ